MLRKLERSNFEPEHTLKLVVLRDELYIGFSKVWRSGRSND